ncbi:hypothetical protein F511_37183 [Dorcoceras hygrometricum]|uniref:Uncharacterized protein n=1 Tax=Dorcoceras hygrometricum TaxID=472368 RepID=A0A2Z7BA55_9LAMI|nr:hypothetical protein F511_37183 [Dorcoceras hygrometricum]
MTFRVVRTNQYNQDLGLIHSKNGNHLESPNEGSSIDHQITIYLHAQNITMFPNNETCERTQLPQEPSVDTLALICIFIEPVQDLDSRLPFSGIARKKWDEVCVDVVQFSLFGHLLLVVLALYDLRIRVILALVLPVSPMHFTTDDIPEIPSSDDALPVEETTVAIPQISLCTTVPSTDYTEEFAQLRAMVDQISIEQVQTRFHIDELKAALSKKITNLETAFLTAYDNQDRVVLVQNNVLCKEMQVQKAALSKELDVIHKEIQDQKAAIAHDLLEFLVESRENFNTLSAQLSEIIAYINRGRDDKKGEDSSSQGPQPPDDRIRPGPGDSGRGRGSSSEPSRKIGTGSYRGGGSRSSRGCNYWFS